MRRRSDRGASAVEFALVMVPLLALLFGAIQYGLYFWAYQGGSDIARSAARLAAVGTPADCASFTSDVKDQIGGMGDKSSAVVTRTYTQADPTKVDIGDTVKVTVQFKSIDLHFPFVPFINDGLVSSSAEARVDYVPTQPGTCS
jgi:Flp pilus assembly protein TadG